MIGFILSAVVLVAIALMFIVPSMLKKNQPISDEYDEFNVSIAKDRLAELKAQRDAGEITEEVFQQMHDELESTLAIDLSNQAAEAQREVAEKNKYSPFIVAAVIPVMAVVLYSQLGDFNSATGETPSAVASNAATQTQQAQQPTQAAAEEPLMSIEEAVAKLEQRLVDEPENPDGWFMVAKTYMSLKQYTKAKNAYEKTIELVGDDPQLLLSYADAVAMTENGSLVGAAKPIVEKVLMLVPENPMALWMSGTSASQQGDFKQALTHWYKLRPMLVGEVEYQAQLEQLISGAESKLSADELVALKQAAPAAELATSAVVSQVATQAPAAEIVVSISLDPALHSKVSVNDTLFIFAKALEGPPMPLAAIKQTAGALPLTVTLNDAMAMMPQMKLSSFEQVKVSAVISKSGQPGAQPGDFYAEVYPVSVAAGKKVTLLISKVK